jgi:hypothetical protein
VALGGETYNQNVYLFSSPGDLAPEGIATRAFLEREVVQRERGRCRLHSGDHLRGRRGPSGLPAGRGLPHGPLAAGIHGASARR